MPDMTINNEVNVEKEANDQLISFYQVDDVQKMLGISRASAYALVKQKGFPCIRVGNRLVIPADLFSKWVVKVAAAGRC